MNIVKKTITVSKSKDGKRYWEQDVYFDGIRKQFRSRISKDKLCLRVDAAIEYFKSKSENENEIRLRNACAIYLEEYPIVKANIHPTRIDSWRKANRGLLKPYYDTLDPLSLTGDNVKLLSDITEADVERIKWNLVNEGKSYATISKTLTIIERLIKFFKRKYNVPQTLDIEDLKVKIPKKKEKDKVVFSNEQEVIILRVIKEECEARDGEMYLLYMVIFCMMTAVRKKNAVRLKWKNINFLNNLIHYEDFEVKNGEFKLGMSKKVRSLLLAMKDYHQKTGSKSEYIFVNSKGVAVKDPKKRFNRIRVILREKYDIIFPHGALWHCFRSSFATQADRLGIDEKDIQSLGHWADPKVMQDHYIKKEFTSKAEVSNKTQEGKNYLELWN